MFFCIQLIGFDDLMRFIIRLSGSCFFRFARGVGIFDDVCDGDDLLGGRADIVRLFGVDMEMGFLGKTSGALLALIWSKMFGGMFSIDMIHQGYFIIGSCICTVWAFIGDAPRFTIFTVIFSAATCH